VPRYVARMKVTRTYRKVVSVRGAEASMDTLLREMDEVVPPVMDQHDWILDGITPVAVTEEEVAETGDGLSGTVEIRVVGRRPMAVYAASEKTAVANGTASCARGRPDVFGVFGYEGWRDVSYETVCESIRRDDGPKRAKPRFEVSIAALIAPDRSLHPLHLDQAYETLRWMVATSANYEQDCSYHVQTVHHLLSGPNPRGSGRSMAPITGADDLKSRFSYAVLGQAYDIYGQWRDEHGIHPQARLTIEALHHASNLDSVRTPQNAGFGNEIDLENILRNAGGMAMPRSLNPVHADAVMVQGVLVAVEPHGFAFELKYGVETTPYASSWTRVLAMTRGAETFYETMDRAIVSFLKLVPDYRDQLAKRRERARTALLEERT
jgi:hypothetical protein